MSAPFNIAKQRLATGDLAWDDGGKDFVVVALANTYTFDPDHATLSQVVSHELSGSGATRAPVEGRNVALNLTANQAELDATDSTFVDIDAGSIGYLVVAEDIGAGDGDKFLVAYLTNGGDPFDLATNGADVLVAYPSGRVVNIT